MKTLSHFRATSPVHLFFAAALTGVAHAGGGPGNGNAPAVPQSYDRLRWP